MFYHVLSCFIFHCLWGKILRWNVLRTRPIASIPICHRAAMEICLVHTIEKSNSWNGGYLKSCSIFVTSSKRPWERCPDGPSPLSFPSMPSARSGKGTNPQVSKHPRNSSTLPGPSSATFTNRETSATSFGLGRLGLTQGRLLAIAQRMKSWHVNRDIHTTCSWCWCWHSSDCNPCRTEMLVWESDLAAWVVDKRTLVTMIHNVNAVEHEREKGCIPISFYISSCQDSMWFFHILLRLMPPPWHCLEPDLSQNRSTHTD